MKVSVTDVYNTIASHDTYTLFIWIEYKGQYTEERKECAWARRKMYADYNDFALVILTIKFINKSGNVLVVSTRDNNYLNISV